MVILPNRRYRRGSIAVAMGLQSSPWIAVYRFDFDSGWGSRYSNPSFVAGFTTEARSVAWAPDGKVVLAGSTSGNFYTYDFDVIDGFGSQSSTAFTNCESICFSQDQSKSLASGPGAFAEYDYSGGTHTLRYSQGSGANSFFQSRYIQEDDYIFAGFVTSLTLRTYRRDAEPPTLVHSFAGNGIAQTISQSPVTLADGSRPVAIPTSTTFLLYRVTDGVFDTALTTPFTNTTVQHAIFDPYGRLIVARSSNTIEIYTISSSGTVTLLDTASGYSGGNVRFMSYDKDQDVLFLGSESSPYVTAFPMHGTGFGTKYSDPGTGVAAGVTCLDVLYDTRWKRFPV